MFDANANHAEQHQQLGACNIHLGQPAKAVTHLETALQIGLSTSATHMYLVKAYAALGNDSAASAHLQAAYDVALNPNFVIINHRLVDETITAHGRLIANTQRQEKYRLRVAGNAFALAC